MVTQSGHNAEPTGDKLLIVDDDVCFGALMSAVAKAHGFRPHFFTSLLEMGSFARIRDYDLALVDYYLESLKGDEIAEYVDTFFSQVPVIIVSAEDFRARPKDHWPASVRRFVPKTDGPERIIEAAKQVLKRERMLTRLAGVPVGAVGATP